MARDILLSVTKKDCEWSYYSGTGAGGQHRNKHMNCVRVSHKPSGARGNSQDFREKKRNEVKAFERMAKTPQMQNWLRQESFLAMGEMEGVKERVEKAMEPKNLRVEIKEAGKWTSK